MTVPSPDNRVEPFGADTDYTPPVFDTARTRKEAPATACADCPSAIWFKKDEWRCFCNIMKFASWPGGPITACDGRETSVARYQMERGRL
jgi:hypothetical protein